jgi:transposase
VLEDHRIAAKKSLLSTRAAKWATRQVGGGRTVLEVADELACEWHTVNDAVCTYGEALLEADRKRHQCHRTRRDVLRQARHEGTHRLRDDRGRRRHHQIIDILPSRTFTDVAAWLDKQPTAWKERIDFGALDMSSAYAAVYSVVLPKATQVIDPFHVISVRREAPWSRKRVRDPPLRAVAAVR